MTGRSLFGRPGHAVVRSTEAIACCTMLAVVTLAAACGTDVPPDAGSPSVSPGPVTPVAVSAAQVARLPLATTFARLRGAPQDSEPFEPVDGVVSHPTAPQVVYAHPGGPPVAVLPTTELGSPTWVPVVQKEPGWARVLLPSRPNRSTGWIYVDGGGLRSAYSAYRVRVDLSAHRLTVFDAGRRLGSWTVAVGAPSTATPTGRTFCSPPELPPARPTAR